MRPRSLVRLGITSATLWLSGASLHLVGWDGWHAEVVGLFPSPRLALPAILLAALLLAAIVLVARTTGQSDRIDTIVSPLNWLIPPIVPFVPGVATWMPLLMVFAGPMKWWLLAVAVASCVGGVRWRTAPDMSGIGRRLVFTISLAIFLAAGWRVTTTLGPTGDEPHFLVLTQSLLADHDLRVENNYENRDFSAYYRGNLRPHLGRAGADGARYSVHAPGTAGLVLPGYALAGYHGAVATTGIVTAIVATLIYVVSRTIAGPSSALLVWIATAFAVPLGVHSWMVYPEVPAALVTALVALWLVSSPPTAAWSWVWRGLVLATLPWIHLKFLPLMIAAAIVFIARSGRRLRSLVLVGPIAVSGLLWLGVTYSMYGLLNPLAPYMTGGTASGGQAVTHANGALGVSVGILAFGAWTLAGNIPQGVLGLLLDQEYGLLILSPAFVLVVPGLYVGLKKPEERGLVVTLALLSLILVLTVASFEMWWGGASAPARFLVPIVPLVAPMSAIALREWRTDVARLIASGLALVSVTIFGAMVMWPSLRLMYDDHDGSGRLVRWLQGPAPLTAVLPTFANQAWTTQLPTIMAWLVAIAASLAIVTSVGRMVRLSPTSSVVSGVIVLLGLASVTTAPFVSEDRRETEVRFGRQDMMFDYREPLRALAVGQWRTLRSQSFFERSALTITVPASDERTGREVAGPFLLPPGRFALEAGIDDVDRSGEILVMSRQNGGVVASGPLSGNRAVTVPFSLDAPESSVVIAASSSALARSVRRVTITPQSLSGSGTDDRN